MASLLVVPIPSIDGVLLHAMREPVHHWFGLDMDGTSSPGLDPAPAFDPARQQHNSTALIAALLRVPLPEGNKILGVTPLDLFVPVLTYVFGEAQLDGRAAVVSSFRLDDRFYGLEANPALLRARFVKEALHELGHTFGLLHCRDFECFMHSSTSVEEIDLKPAQLCGGCVGKLKEKTGRGKT